MASRTQGTPPQESLPQLPSRLPENGRPTRTPPVPLATAAAPQQKPSTLDPLLTKVFAATKRLLDSLTGWAKASVPDATVSDNFVTLITHFYNASDVLEAAEVSMSDLKSVPDALRDLLETTLAEPPSAASLERHMPQIKDLVVSLLGGLRKKQAAYNAAFAGTGEKPKQNVMPGRASSGTLETSERVHGLDSPEASRRTGSPSEIPQRLPGPRRESVPVSAGDAASRSPSRKGDGKRASSLVRSTKSAPSLAVDVPAPLDEEAESGTTASGVGVGSPGRGATQRNGALNLRGNRRRSYAKSTTAAPNDERDVAALHSSNGGPGPEEVIVTIPHLFLQVANVVKRTSFSGVLTISALKMLFMDKFKYSPGRDDFPEIYIRDGATGIFHELERLTDIGEGTYLKLMTSDPVEQIRKDMEHSMSTLTKEIRELKRLVMDNNDTVRRSAAANVVAARAAPPHNLHNLVKRVVSQQMSASALSLNLPPLAMGSAAPSPTTTAPFSPGIVRTPAMALEAVQRLRTLDVRSTLDDLQSLRRDLGIARQHVTTFHEEMKQRLGVLREQAASFKAGMTLYGDSAQSLIAAGRAKLGDKVAKLATRLEELQTTIEDLRTDVVVRRARPAPARMRQVAEENAAIRAEIDDLLGFVDEMRPVWKKTWEDELHNIVKEQTFLKDQEAAIDDLDDDQVTLSELLDRLRHVVALQESSSPMGPSPGPSSAGSAGGSRGFTMPQPEKGHEGLSTVMQEISGVMPDSDRRVRAMEQAEKLRRKALEAKVDEFEEELSSFVVGKRLKKTGGTAEVERMRQKKNDNLLKAMFQNIP